jgi:enoyl-CoA hydratase/carnithine racemase
MQYEQILTEVHESVLTITLNRPQKLNAWTRQMEGEFRDAVEAGAADERVRAIVVTGAGRGFCAGADMSALEAAGTATHEQRAVAASEHRADHGADLEANYDWKFSYLLRVPKPVFAAINGPVAGIGLCMTMFCDFRHMARGQKLTTSFARRGLIAEHGISWMLPRLIGPSHALDLLLSARTLDTDEAAVMGLVKALPADGFLPAVQATAREMAALASPRSIRVIKKQVYDALFQTLDEAWRQADAEMLLSFASEDFKEGVAHYLEKRAPSFTGR